MTSAFLTDHAAFEFFSFLLLVYLSFCLHVKAVVPSNMTDPLRFPLPCRVQHFLFICNSKSFLITNLTSQLIFSILLDVHTSKVSNLLSVPVSNDVDACCYLFILFIILLIFIFYLCLLSVQKWVSNFAQCTGIRMILRSPDLRVTSVPVSVHHTSITTLYQHSLDGTTIHVMLTSHPNYTAC